MKSRINKEEGQTLPFAIMILTVGALLVGGFLSYMSTNLMASNIFNNFTADQYAADAGAEDAIWNLLHGDLTTTVLTESGDNYTYSLNETVNGVTPEVSITRGQAIAASDNFESNDWSGGNGWLGAWVITGDASIETARSPYEGTYHLQLTSNDGYAKREINLSDSSADNLLFWAKARSFEPGEDARCYVSFNGSDWEEVQRWENGDDDDTYRLYEIDLSSYDPFSQLWIAFEANMSRTGDQLYVDDLRLVKSLTDNSSRWSADNDFESGGWSGGSNWLDDWHHEGSSQITTSGRPNGGSRHLMMTSSNSYVKRAVDLSAQSDVHLLFWAKARSFESGDEMYCLVSSNGSDWDEVQVWENGDDDNAYHFFDIDLSSYTMSSEFWIAFDSDMNRSNDYFYFDDINVVGASTGVTDYEIVSNAGSKTVRSIVTIQDSDLTINSWQID